MTLPDDPQAAGLWTKAERERLNLSAAEVARRINLLAAQAGDPVTVSQQVVSKYEQGGTKRKVSWHRFIVPALAGAPTGAEPDDPDLAMVGIRFTDASFGLGAAFNEFDHQSAEGEVLQFPKAWIESLTYSPPEMLGWAYARGGSMAPTIGDGDMVLIDRSDRKVEDQDLVWAFAVGETRAIKRLRVKGDRFMILSDSETSPPDEEPIRDVHIVGRVIRVVKRT